jgi:SH3 domain-containing YSC84-like protein 1
MMIRTNSLSRRNVIAGGTALLGMGAATPALADAKRQALVNDALRTAQKVLEGKDTPDARKHMPKARAVMIMPAFAQAAFIIGGAGGRAVMLARGGQADWSSPAFYSLGSGSIGLQIGGRVQEIVLIILTDKGLNALMNDKFKFGAEAGLTFAREGAGVAGATTSAVGADIVSLSTASGLFAGGALEGSFVEPDNDWNALYYGLGASPRAILLERRFSNPGANALRQYLGRV